MRAVVQRVKKASITVRGEKIREIKDGLVVFVGVHQDDSEKDLNYVVEKVVNLRIFSDEKGKMNLSATELKKDLLVVSQFTLYGDVRKGRRPGFDQAASAEKGRTFFELALKKFRETGLRISCGIFQEHMEISLVNDGPVTILLDSEKVF